jgi:hypothetical protein
MQHPDELAPYIRVSVIDEALTGRDPRHDPLGRCQPEYASAIAALKAAGSRDGIRVEEKLTLSRTEWANVGRGVTVCPICNGSGDDYRNLEIVGTGVKLRTSYRCLCREPKMFYRRFDEMCPPIYRDAIWFPTLGYSDKSDLPEDAQKYYIGLLKANPRASYLLCGPRATSKTAYEIALLQKACLDEVDYYFHSPVPNKASRGVFRISASNLINEWHAYQTDRSSDGESSPAPTISEEKIRSVAKRGFKPRVFISEFDKVTLNDRREDFLFGIFDAIYETGSQLVLTSNMDPIQLCSRFRDHNAGAFLRRISGDHGTGFIWNFYDELGQLASK